MAEPGSGKPDWRQGAKQDWRNRGAAPSSTPRWAKAKPSTAPPASRLRMRVAASFAVLFVLLSVFCAWVFWMPRKTPFVTLVVTNYDFPVAPNSWAGEDAEAFRLLGAPQRQLQFHDISPSSDWWREGSSQSERFLKHVEDQLANIQQRRSLRDRFWPQATVVYLSMHGMANSSGEACLLLPGAQDRTAGAWTLLPVSKVLSAISRAAPGKKLLILDANRMRRNWPLGLLDNSFVSHLQAALDDTADPDLFVLNSTGSGQAGWSSADLGGSIFAHYVWLGLQGQANTDGDESVSLQELYAYVRNRVVQWTTDNRDEIQEPILLPAGGDRGLRLTWTVAEKEQVERPTPSGPHLNHDTLLNLWRHHQRLAADPRVRGRYPVALQQLARRLVWLEELNAAGKAYKQPVGDVRKDLEKLVTELESAGDGIQAHSLALAQRLVAQDGDDRQLQAVEQFLRGCQNQPGRIAEMLAKNDKELAALPAEPVEVHLLRLVAKHLPSTWLTNPAVGKVLQAQSLGEQAAAPQDDRVHYWVQSIIDQADRQRRQAEDRLFVGGTALEEAGPPAVTASQDYQQAIQRAQRLTTAFQLRDRAWAELPYHALWLMEYAPPNPGKGAANSQSDAGLEPLRQSLPTLAHDARALAASLETAWEQIERGQPLGTEHSYLWEADSADWPVDSPASRLDRGLQALQARVQSELEQLSKSTANPATLRQSLVLLRVPLVSGDQRAQLLQHSSKIAADRYREWSSGTSGAAAGRDSERPQPPASGAPSETLHVIAELLNDDGKASAKLGNRPNLDVQGDWVRQCLTDWAKELQPPRETRPTMAQADARARIAAALWADSPWKPAATEPSCRLADLVLHHLLLWHVDRVLADFWGPGNDQRRPFFAEAARDYLNQAMRLGERAGVAGDEVTARLNRVKQLETLAGRTEPNANQSLQIRGKQQSGLPILDSGQQRGGRLVVSWSPNFGPFLAAVVLDGESSAGSDARHAIDLSAGGPQEVAYDVSQPGTNPGGKTQASPMALVRGHVFPGLSVPTIAFAPDIVLEHTAPKYSEPIVRVTGNPQRGQLMFILDCSGTMSIGNRFRDACRALDRFLQALVAGDSYDVGLRIFGHRVGFQGGSNPQTAYALSWNKNFRERPPGLIPTTDIERVFPIAPFGQPERQAIAKKLEGLHALGITPSYLAIIRAVEQDFDDNLSVGTRRIIMVTDGENNQEDNGLLKDASQRKSAQNVIDALKLRASRHPGQPVELDVVLFPEKIPTELERLANEQQVKINFRSAGDVETLIRRLRALVGAYTYHVEAGGVALPEKDLGAETEVKLQQAAAANCRVLIDDTTIASEPFLLDRGQRVDFIVRNESLRLQADPPTGLASAVVTDPQSPETSYQVTAHRTIRTGNQVEFPISLQDHSRIRVTRRPAETWVEIRPRGQMSPVFRFYDPEFVDKQPLPMLLCRVPQWGREQWKQAEIRLFGKFRRKTDPQHVVRVDAAAGQNVQVPGLEGLDVSVRREPVDDGFRVVVVEDHSRRNGDLYQLKVEMYPPAQRWSEEIDSAHRMIRHRFVYPRTGEQQVGTYEVRFTSRAGLEDRSVKLAEPLVVDVE